MTKFIYFGHMITDIKKCEMEILKKNRNDKMHIQKNEQSSYSETKSTEVEAESC